MINGPREEGKSQLLGLQEGVCVAGQGRGRRGKRSDLINVLSEGQNRRKQA